MRVDLLLRWVHLATMLGDAGDPYGSMRDAALAVADGRIVWLGKEADLPSGLHADEEIDGEGGWLTPGLIDCHTHLVYAGNRADEFERRLNGQSYESIARSGAGIRATVSATRAADEATLYAKSRKRLQTMLNEGVTTVEIKSGYGLDLASERKMLRVARQLGAEGASVRTSFLGAHAVPPEYAGRADDYLDVVINEMLPALHAEGLIDAVDGFCEDIAFSPAQIRRLFDAATRLGLPVKIHHMTRVMQQFMPRLRKKQLFPQTLKKRHVIVLLKLSHRLAHRRLRHMQFFSCPGHPHFITDTNKNT